MGQQLYGLNPEGLSLKPKDLLHQGRKKWPCGLGFTGSKVGLQGSKRSPDQGQDFTFSLHLA
jgi:hypothetical protein